jgi:hypothetical protein
VVIFLADRALRIPPIQAELVEPLPAGIEHLQLARAEAFSHVLNAGLDGLDQRFRWWRYSGRPVAMLEFNHPSFRGSREQQYYALASAVREIASQLQLGTEP